MAKLTHDAVREMFLVKFLECDHAFVVVFSSIGSAGQPIVQGVARYVTRLALGLGVSVMTLGVR